MSDFSIITDNPSNISFYAYNNNTFVIHSLIQENISIDIIVKKPKCKLTDLETNEIFAGYLKNGHQLFKIILLPYSSRAFSF